MTEIPMKQWRYEMARKYGISAEAIAGYISPTRRAALLGKRRMVRDLTYPEVRRVNKRVVYVQIYQ